VSDATREISAPALALVGITKRFGTVSALDGATLTLHTGTVHALLGENGAGKTTLMRIAFGMIRPDAGELLMDGRRVEWRTPADAILAGVGMVHQHFTLVPAMTVAENVELGAGKSDNSKNSARWTSRWRYDRRSAEDRVRELGRAAGLNVEPGAFIAGLSVATQQRVEILKALSRAAKILILDEPTAVLAPKESDELIRWLRAYVDRGGTAILITHKLREALAVADDVTVLRRGRTVLVARRSEVDEVTLTRAMIGGDLASTRYPVPAQPSAKPSPKQPIVVLEDVVADDAERRERIHASLTVRAGELVGIAGVEGAGHHTLLRVIAGRIRPSAGRLIRPDQVGFVPEDRQRDGLILEFSLVENVALHRAGSRRGRMPWARIRRRTAVLMQEFDVRAGEPLVTARALSGGNQQRLILARELDGRPPLLVAENPTRGLDVRATTEVRERLRAARDEGTAIVLYSSDLDEVLALATRILALHAGTVREVPADRDLVGRAILSLP
jgi:general nucleoside transport system ATP-binding protein